jgi:transposase
VSEVAKDLGCGWHPVMDAVVAYGQALVDDPDRFGDVSALGLDETLRCRIGEWRRQSWTTQIVDVEVGQLLDVVEGRTATGPIHWLAERPQHWRDGVEWATLDLSGPYRKVFDVMLPDATQVADPFHLVRLAKTPSWMNAGAGSRTRPSVIGDARTTRCIEPAGSSPRRTSVSTRQVTPSCVGCCMPGTREVRCR